MNWEFIYFAQFREHNQIFFIFSQHDKLNDWIHMRRNFFIFTNLLNHIILSEDNLKCPRSYTISLRFTNYITLSFIVILSLDFQHLFNDNIIDSFWISENSHCIINFLGEFFQLSLIFQHITFREFLNVCIQ